MLSKNNERFLAISLLPQHYIFDCSTSKEELDILIFDLIEIGKRCLKQGIKVLYNKEIDYLAGETYTSLLGHNKFDKFAQVQIRDAFRVEYVEEVYGYSENTTWLEKYNIPYSFQGQLNNIYNKQITNYKNSIVLDPYCNETCLIELLPESQFLKTNSLQENMQLLDHIECFFTSYLRTYSFEISILIDIFSQYEALLFNERKDLLYFHEEFQDNIKNADNGIEIALSSARGIYAPRYKIEQLGCETPRHMIECHPDGKNSICIDNVKHTALRCYVLPLNASTTAQGSAKRIYLAESYGKFVIFGYTDNHEFNYERIPRKLQGIFSL